MENLQNNVRAQTEWIEQLEIFTEKRSSIDRTKSPKIPTNMNKNFCWASCALRRGCTHEGPSPTGLHRRGLRGMHCHGIFGSTSRASKRNDLNCENPNSMDDSVAVRLQYARLYWIYSKPAHLGAIFHAHAAQLGRARPTQKCTGCLTSRSNRVKSICQIWLAGAR